MTNVYSGAAHDRVFGEPSHEAPNQHLVATLVLFGMTGGEKWQLARTPAARERALKIRKARRYAIYAQPSSSLTSSVDASTPKPEGFAALIRSVRKPTRGLYFGQPREKKGYDRAFYYDGLFHLWDRAYRKDRPLYGYASVGRKLRLVDKATCLRQVSLARGDAEVAKRGYTWSRA